MPIVDHTSNDQLTGVQDLIGRLIGGIQDHNGNVIYELPSDFYQEEFFVAVDQIFVNADFIYGTTGDDLWRRPLIGGQTTQFDIPSASSGTIVGVGGDATNLLVIDSDNDIYQTPFANLTASPTWALFSTQLPDTITDTMGLVYVSDNTSGGYYVTYDDHRLAALETGNTAWGTSNVQSSVSEVDTLVDAVGWQDSGVFFGVLNQSDATIYARSTTNTNYGKYEFPASVTSPRGASRHGNYYYVSHGTKVTRHAVSALDYGVPVRNSNKDISLGDGLWTGGASDGTTLWFCDNVSFSGVRNIRAYVAATQARDADKDIERGVRIAGGASDGTTLWFVDDNNTDPDADAFVAATQARDADKDIRNLQTGVEWTGGATSDGTTIWFVDNTNNRATAYTIATKARTSALDISLGTDSWAGAASDGTTLWFVNDTDNNAVAYTASTRVRNSDLDISLSDTVWLGAVCDGDTIWFTDTTNNMAVAYDL